MYDKKSKKMLSFCILDILQKYTDENHCLSQKEIEEILRSKYDMDVDRKSVKRNLMDLIDMGIDIQFEERTRMVKDCYSDEKEEQFVLTNFYLQRDISDCEIRLITDALLDLDFIPEHQRLDLIKKIERLTSVYFRENSIMKRRILDCSRNENSQLFYTLDNIDEAIMYNKTLVFSYSENDLLEKNCISKETEFNVKPLGTEMIDGKYYLRCFVVNGRSSFRIDYIKNMRCI